ncbi:MAG: alpha/beta fold hydrolase [Armatimonadota bacterium]|nr:alpha/beta fold hydrolase [Armatimonadota bacterium]
MNADRYVEVLGARIRYRVEGRGPAVVLIHGLGASLESWRWTIPALRDRYTVVALDFPGFGRSEPIPTAYVPDGAAMLTLAFMDAIRVPDAALIGASLGGSIAVMTAGASPARCAALVLVAPVGFDRAVGLGPRLATLPVVGEAMIRAIGLYPPLGAPHAFVDRRRFPKELIDAARRDFTEGTAGPTCLRVVRNLAGFWGVRPEVVARVREAASRITAPTLILWGSRDRVLAPRQATAAARAIPRARLYMMDGAGHVPFIEEAGDFNTAVTAFLASVDRRLGAGARR